MFSVDYSVGGARLRLKPRSLCPHCRKVVIGKLHVRECVKLRAKDTTRGCKECGDPVKGRCLYCKPCGVERRRDSIERSKNRPGYREKERAYFAVYFKTPNGLARKKASAKRSRAKSRAKDLIRMKKWRDVNKARRAAYMRNYYLMHTEQCKAYSRKAA